ncbi:MAG: TlyA family RNA methyltransferase [Phycisphaerales bacterium JB059]
MPDDADTSPPPSDPSRYVSRGALKLEHALRTFNLDVTGWIGADLGCSTGGFTDCLLQHGAARVYSVDTAYGELAWKLRQDERVTVMERSNALHTEPHPDTHTTGGVDLVVIDLGWTRQDKAIPAALMWARPGAHIITLIKPHYEADRTDLGEGGVLDPDRSQAIASRVVEELPAMGVEVLGVTESPVLGGAVKAKRKRKGAGNREWLALLRVKDAG